MKHRLFLFPKIAISGRHEIAFFSFFRKIAIQGVMKKGFFGFPKIRFFSAPGKIDFSLSEK
jgi:hypothetical protein